MNERYPHLLRDAAVLILRLFLGGMFVYASLHKLGNPVEFSRIIYNYHILPHVFINLFAIVLPGVELLAGLCLIAGLMTRGAVLTIAASLAVFVIAIGFNLARGLEFDCGCFSFAKSKQGAAYDLLVRDVVYLAMALGVLCAKGHALSIDRLAGVEGRSPLTKPR